MKIKPFHRLFLVALLSVSPNVIASQEVLDAVPVPDNASTETVAINILQNGHRLSIANLKTSESVESVLVFYREQWKEPLSEDVPGFVENTAGEWSIISRPKDDWNQVVQIRPSGNGVDGRVSVMNLVASADAIDDMAMPGNSSLVSSTGAQDIGHSSSTYVIVSKSGIDSISRFYRRHFENEGWSRVSDKNTNNSQVMLLQRTGERAELVISGMPTGGSLILINKVLNDG